MNVFALPAVWAAPPGEEKAKVFHAGCVGTGEARVASDAAAGLRFGFAMLIMRRKVKVG